MACTRSQINAAQGELQVGYKEKMCACGSNQVSQFGLM
jgi:hypothetical protein